VEKHLSSKCKALSSNPGTAETKAEQRTPLLLWGRHQSFLDSTGIAAEYKVSTQGSCLYAEEKTQK
jgi:hypothetical protein